MTQPVVDVREASPGVMLVTMQDRVHKNTFSVELMQGLVDAFAAIEANPQVKAVVLTGYDSYFASGGTQEGLLAIYEGRVQFTDARVYSLALDCKVPVIAAMQGHGIGGGFVMGLFADMVVMSRESVYTCNFMKYGFTPGFGATCVVPKKLGLSLGAELLLNGGTYRGGDLEKRGVPFPVLPREQVLPRALEMAQELAEKPRLSLVMLKDHLMASLREELPRVIEQELAMHDKTFHQPEVKERILGLFSN